MGHKFMNEVKLHIVKLYGKDYFVIKINGVNYYISKFNDEESYLECFVMFDRRIHENLELFENFIDKSNIKQAKLFVGYMFEDKFISTYNKCFKNTINKKIIPFIFKYKDLKYKLYCLDELFIDLMPYDIEKYTEEVCQKSLDFLEKYKFEQTNIQLQ